MNKFERVLYDVITIIRNDGFKIMVYEENGIECDLDLETITSNLKLPITISLDLNLDDRKVYNVFDICDSIREWSDSFNIDDEIDARIDSDFSGYSYEELTEELENYKLNLRGLSEIIEGQINLYNIRREEYVNAEEICVTEFGVEKLNYGLN